MRGLLAAAAALLLSGACTSGLGPLPLDVRVEASRVAAAPGDTITFVITAQGGSLVGVEIDYADGTAGAYAAPGARTARVIFDHVYVATGTYLVKVVVTDAVAGQKNTSVEIRVQ